MRQMFCLIVVIFSVSLLVEPASAQIGQGRLLKKFRNDLFGPSVSQRQSHEQQRRVEAQRRAKLEAQRRANQARQPNTTQNRQPTLQNRQPNTQNRQPTTNNGHQTVRSKYPTNPSQIQRPTTTRPRTVPAPRTAPTPRAITQVPAPQRAVKKTGFGFQLVEKNEQLIVTRIDQGGNALKSGIKQGDRIVGIGGIDVKTKKGFDDIAEILNDGDTIEMAFQRGGKVDEIRIAFGESPEAPAAELSVAPEKNPSNFAPNHSPAHPVSTTLPNHRQIEELNQTVRQQQNTILQLQSEVRRLRSNSSSHANGQARSVLTN